MKNVLGLNLTQTLEQYDVMLTKDESVKSMFSDRDHASTALRQRAQDRRSVHA